ncbi:polysaccharide deacetylase family protein [Nonomuraea sediminis]|uniref:polysaccharide deacetylase family protein n=1 Tax=Nonomuraea sediminis TaxID=2835864 RepID=UPI001BDBD3D0|nr:polysaccharide deacetylase family protein [Nonomuraea sediminis]
MRAWGASAALLLAVAGCGVIHPLTDAPVRPPAVIKPAVLAKRLIAMQPGWPVKPSKPDCRRAKCVALTFDDGPGRYTGHLLDILRRRGVRATFFVLGENVAADKGRNLRRIVTEGHEIGNHTWNHAALTTLPRERIRNQLERTERLVRRLTGIRMRLMRPPYGATDRRVADVTRREGLAQILWSVDTLDWRDRVPAVVARRAGAARPGSIILMHDIHRTTVAAVPRVIDKLKHKGYTFVTVSDLYGKPLVPGRKYAER